MSNKEKDYFIPEQLEDDDFEKEKIEDKKRRKEKLFNKFKSSISGDEENNFNKNNKLKIIAMIFIIVLIIIGVVWYVTPHEKKVSEPEKTTRDFCAYLNAGNWNKLNELMDLKSYYILEYILKEINYTQFDATYEKFKGDETYNRFEESINILTNIDDDVLDSLASVQIRLNNIEACNKIQGTDTLYKLRVNFDYIYNGQIENDTGVLFVTNASGEYKMAFGDWMQTILNYYQSVYMMQSNYNY